MSQRYHRGLVSARNPVAWAVLLVVGLGGLNCAVAQDTQDHEVLAAVSKAMSNPISSLIIFQNQFQLTQYKLPAGWTPAPGVMYPSEREWGFQFQLITRRSTRTISLAADGYFDCPSSP